MYLQEKVSVPAGSVDFDVRASCPSLWTTTPNSAIGYAVGMIMRPNRDIAIKLNTTAGTAFPIYADEIFNEEHGGITELFVTASQDTEIYIITRTR